MVGVDKNNQLPPYWFDREKVRERCVSTITQALFVARNVNDFDTRNDEYNELARTLSNWVVAETLDQLEAHLETQGNVSSPNATRASSEPDETKHPKKADLRHEDVAHFSPEAQENAIVQDRSQRYGDATFGHENVGLIWQGILQNYFQKYIGTIPAHIVLLMLGGLKTNRAAFPSKLFPEDYMDMRIYNSLSEKTYRLPNKSTDDMDSLERE